MADEWDRFPDASPASSRQQPAPAVPASTPPASEMPPEHTWTEAGGFYGLDRDGHLVIYYGGHKLRPMDRPQVGAGEHGLPHLPPLPQQGPLRQPEMWSGLHPFAERVAGATGVPELGQATDATISLGRATGDAAGAFAGTPMLHWGAERGAALGEAAARDDGSLFPSAQAQQETPDQVMDLQRRMQADGYYTGKIDGNRGPETRKAIERYQADAPKREAAEAQRRQQELDLQRSQGDAAAANARAAEAKARQDEAAAAKQASESAEVARVANEQTRKLGFERLKEAEANRNPVARALEDNATAIGWMGGGFAGHLARGVVTKFANSQLADKVARANALLPNGGQRDVSGRVGRVNQFYSEGGAPEVPFTVTPGGKVSAIKPNPNAAPASNLYQPNTKVNAGVDASVIAAGGGESLAAHQFLVAPAEQELGDAYKAVQESPTEANIQRLLSARGALAVARGGETFGRGTALGYAASMPVVQRSQSRPDISRAEAEVVKIDQFLRDLKASRGARGPGGGPQSPLPGKGLSLQQTPRPQSLGAAATTQGAPALPAPLAQSTQSSTPGQSAQPSQAPEVWKSPNGDLIKRGKSGKTWHNEGGDFSSPPPKGSKRISVLDRLLYYGGFA